MNPEFGMFEGLMAHTHCVPRNSQELSRPGRESEIGSSLGRVPYKPLDNKSLGTVADLLSQLQ